MIKDKKEWIEKIQNSEKIIIVEGKKDKKALISLGVKNIITLNKPLYKIVEETAEFNKNVIILTDFDKEGRKLYGVLKNDFQKNGVKIDREFRVYRKIK